MENSESKKIKMSKIKYFVYGVLFGLVLFFVIDIVSNWGDAKQAYRDGYNRARATSQLIINEK